MARKKASEFYSFVSGYVQDSETLRIIAQLDDLIETGEPNSTLMKWVRSENKWYSFDFDWFATSLSVVLTPELQVFAAGPDGRVMVGTIHGEQQEKIDPSEDGPDVHGDIRDLRIIGKHLYLVGMGRQVYRRESGKWVRRDAGVLQTPDLDEVKGFNAIDGLSEDDIYAVGWDGEIWHLKKGTWRQIESPTNVILNGVRVIKKNLAFACGQNGILLRGYGDTWDVVEQDGTDDQIWDLEWFKDTLYLATDDAIYQLLPDDTLEPVDMRLGDEVTCGSLHAKDGVLLSVGTKHVCFTEDGVNWQDADP